MFSEQIKWEQLFFLPGAVKIFGKIKDHDPNNRQSSVPMEDKQDEDGYHGMVKS